ncbi:MAG: hypothetical protein ACIAS6_06780 [Phycisphaerales bacterium JB060]
MDELLKKHGAAAGITGAAARMKMDGLCPYALRATAATNAPHALEHQADIAIVQIGSGTPRSRRSGCTTGGGQGRRIRRRLR